MSQIAKVRPEETAVDASGRLTRLVWQMLASVADRLNGDVTLNEYTVARLPNPTGDKRLVWVTDAGGGAVPAYSDGVAWRRVTDGTTVS
jgi:hypothetical protein